MIATERKALLVLAYGNPGRRDDGVGPAFADALDAEKHPSLSVEVGYQLNIEDAATMAGHAQVLFVDARMAGPEPFTLDPVEPAPSITFTSHTVSPGSVLAICEEHFGPAPEAWVLGIRGYDFDLGEGLTPRATRNLRSALQHIRDLLQFMEGIYHD